MPFLTIERGHGAVSDHTIGVPRVPDPAVPAGDRVATDACTACHTGARDAPPGAPRLDGRRLFEAYAAWWPSPKPLAAWTVALSAGRTFQPGAEPRLLAAAGDPSVPPLARATAAFLLGRYEGAKPGLLQLARSPEGLVRRGALRALASFRGPDVDAAFLAALKDPSPAVRARAARAAFEGFARVMENRPLLEAAVPVLAVDAAEDPGDDLRWARLAGALDLLGDVPGAIRAYERKLALDPFAADVRERLEVLRRASAGR
jgi:HEAT repeat protein